jgi:hypothetical protein
MSGKIAVIGSNSFSGASFVRTCLEQGLEVLRHQPFGFTLKL